MSDTKGDVYQTVPPMTDTVDGATAETFSATGWTLEPICDTIMGDDPNAAMDTQNGVKSKTQTRKGSHERLRILKNAQTAAVRKVTMKRTELSQLMSSEINMNKVHEKLTEYNVLYQSYQECYHAHCEQTEDEDYLQHESKRYDTNEMSILNFRIQVQDWLSHTEQRLHDELDRASSKRSSHRSHTSRSSRTSSRVARQEIKAHLAELLVEKTAMVQQQELEFKQQALRLEVDIAKAKAKEKAFTEDEQEHISVVNQLNSNVVSYAMSITTPVYSSSHVHTTTMLDSNTATLSKSVLTSRYNMIPSSQFNAITCVSNLSSSTVLTYSNSMPKVTATVDSQHQQYAQLTQPISGLHNSGQEEESVIANANLSHLNPMVDQFYPSHPPTSSTTTNVNQQLIEMQQRHNDSLLSTYHQIASVMSLPSPEVPKFKGDPMEYNTFALAFNARISSRATTNADRLYYLQQQLEGVPRELISGCLHMRPDDGYVEAWNLLQREYGNPHKVSMAYVNKVLDWPAIKPDDGPSLSRFSYFLIKCQYAMQNITDIAVLDHAPNLQAIVRKLPLHLQNKWRDNVHQRIAHEHRFVNFNDIVIFIKDAAETINEPVFSKDALSRGESKFIKQQQHAKTFGTGTNASFVVNVNADQEQTTETNFKPRDKCYFCEQAHDLDDCESFSKRSIDEKRMFFKEKRLCFGCIGLNHTSKGCLKKRTCRICKKRHPTCLHIEGFALYTDPRQSYQPSTSTHNVDHPSVSNHTCVTSQIGSHDLIIQAILPVMVAQGKHSSPVKTYAFYDHGSTGCFLSEELMESINAKGPHTTLMLRTMHGQGYVDSAVIDNLIVTDLNGNNAITLPKTYLRTEIPVSHEQIPRPEMIAHLPHLMKIAGEIPAYQRDLNIGLLIGSNCPMALEPLNVIPVVGDGPFAAQFRHGWTINGPLQVRTDNTNNSMTCHRIIVREMESSKEIISPERAINILETDFRGCQVGKVPGERGHSQEDISFLCNAARDIRLVEGHYVLPLPFRNDNVHMPENRYQVLKRTLWQKKKMSRDVKYHNDYTAFISNLLDKGFAAKIPESRLNTRPGQVWYLPHHGVYNPKKPGKIRVVFDASAKFSGISLNDLLIPGPDLTNSLVGVLTRFRLDSIAFMADIEQMFYQVKIPDQQYDFLRFFWWPQGNLNNEPQEYYMKVHLFGATSSPSISNFALRQISIDNKATLSNEIIQTLLRHFYVDDCLRSLPSSEDTIQLIRDLKLACQKGGFHITKFTSNDTSVIMSIPKEEQSKELKTWNLEYDELPIEHALGIQWSIESDVFSFNVLIPNKPLTRRGILSIVASVYDPLGFIAPFVLIAKKILQELCKEKDLDWDDPIPEQYQQRFVKWIHDTSTLRNVVVSRCVKPTGFGLSKCNQLHVFADASTLGYGSVAYLRIDDGNTIHASFLIGKARLAPTKMTTIPRLELTAATTAVYLGQMMKTELDLPIHEITYHTDSTTVIHYIRSNSKRFPVFVANRVRQIRDFASPHQWKYINTNDNPADVGSRGVDSSSISNLALWLNGPSFLCTPETEWTKQPDLAGNLDMHMHEDESCLTTTINVTANMLHPLDVFINYYSDWYKLQRAVAIFLSWRRMLCQRIVEQDNKCEITSNPFTAECIEEAEHVIIKHVQCQQFRHEIETLQSGNVTRQRGRTPKRPCVSKSSSLYRLDPYVDNDMLKVGGRLAKSQLPEAMKHPVLLPHKSAVTLLIIRDAHQSLGHAGRNHTIAKLQERYWIINVNSAVRQCIQNCITCRRFRKPCGEQHMADLPFDRTKPAPPFTYTGVDYFGPFTVKEGRKRHKRYGVIFTCLVSRAVHLETSNTLETDSFLNALQRFICRRGPVKQIRCDNGTNFVGAERELREAINELDQNSIRDKLLRHKISWKFNPPTASHMGGSWERIIQSVRKILASLLREHDGRLDDETLRTLLCEVECILNSRPLTTVASHPDDLEALSPNHILTMKPVILPPPGRFDKPDGYLRKRWRRVQYLANLFWTRFKREYLVTLQKRVKWNNLHRNLETGDIVLLRDDTCPRFNWPLGMVTSTLKDSKGLVRSVKLRTQSSELHRPIHKLVLLIPVEERE